MSKEAMKLAHEVLLDNRHYIVEHESAAYLEIYDESITAVEKALAEQPAQQEPCGWQFFQDGKWHNGMDVNDHRRHTEAAGFPVRDVYPSPQPAQQEPVTEFKSPGQRWEDGDDHDSRSEALYKFIAYTDFKHCGDSFCFKSGGDGDNGETLMFILDCWFAQQHTSPQPAQQEQKPVALREALREAAAAALTSVYVCGRVWSAWHIGTMTEDDFSPASECDWLLDEIVHAVATAAPQPAQRKPLTDEQWQQIADITNTVLTRQTKNKIEAVIGIKENT